MENSGNDNIKYFKYCDVYTKNSQLPYDFYLKIVNNEICGYTNRDFNMQWTTAINGWEDTFKRTKKHFVELTKEQMAVEILINGKQRN